MSSCVPRPLSQKRIRTWRSDGWRRAERERFESRRDLFLLHHVLLKAALWDPSQSSMATGGCPSCIRSIHQNHSTEHLSIFPRVALVIRPNLNLFHKNGDARPFGNGRMCKLLLLRRQGIWRRACTTCSDADVCKSWKRVMSHPTRQTGSSHIGAVQYAYYVLRVLYSTSTLVRMQ